jgi:hypothetical protein
MKTLTTCPQNHSSFTTPDAIPRRQASDYQGTSSQMPLLKLQLGTILKEVLNSEGTREMLVSEQRRASRTTNYK